MGPEKYQLWKDGKFKLDDLSKLQTFDGVG